MKPGEEFSSVYDVHVFDMESHPYPSDNAKHKIGVMGWWVFHAVTTCTIFLDIEVDKKGAFCANYSSSSFALPPLLDYITLVNTE